MVQRFAQIPYNYDPDDRYLGYLNQTNTRVTVREGYNAEIHGRALTIDHDHYLPLYFVDEEGRNMVHHAHRISLEVYIADLQLHQIYPVMTYTIPGRAAQPITCRYVPPQYRILFKSIFKFVVDQHLEGFSLVRFSIKDLVVVGDVLKFLGVGFRAATPDTRREDIECILHIMAQVFGGYQPYPMDLDHLAALMMTLDYTRKDDGVVLLHHLSIMSPKEAILFFINCDDMVIQLSGQDASGFQVALRTMPDCSNWGTYFNDPTSGLAYINQCYRVNIQHYRYGHPHSATAVKHSFLRCCRNIAVHLKGHAPRGTQFMNKDVQSMIMQVVGEKLLAFHEHLHSAGVLQAFIN